MRWFSFGNFLQIIHRNFIQGFIYFIFFLLWFISKTRHKLKPDKIKECLPESPPVSFRPAGGCRMGQSLDWEVKNSRNTCRIQNSVIVWPHCRLTADGVILTGKHHYCMSRSSAGLTQISCQWIKKKKNEIKWHFFSRNMAWQVGKPSKILKLPQKCDDQLCQPMRST